MAQFDLPSLEGAIAIDSGASTGGFTDCMLQNGAAKVYAVDVGYGQLAWSLRQDPRVVCMERTNVRYLTQETIPEPLDFGSVDVSFISLKLILPALRPLMKETGAEDFSVYLEHIPGVFGFVGFQNEEKGIVCTHHHPSFDLDEDVLWKGTGIYVKFAVDYLKKNA
jgi:TlyA family rRNA methyltransferase/putative hemolysin